MVRGLTNHPPCQRLSSARAITTASSSATDSGVGGPLWREGRASAGGVNRGEGRVVLRLRLQDNHPLSVCRTSQICNMDRPSWILAFSAAMGVEGGGRGVGVLVFLLWCRLCVQ